MKALAKFALIAALLSVVYGCASTGSSVRLPPPEAMNPIFMRYKQLPENKVFVVAVDPTGRWAFGYDHSQSSLEEAAKNAAIKCDIARKKHNVLSQPKIFSINNDVVYYEQK